MRTSHDMYISEDRARFKEVDGPTFDTSSPKVRTIYTLEYTLREYYIMWHDSPLPSSASTVLNEQYSYLPKLMHTNENEKLGTVDCSLYLTRAIGETTESHKVMMYHGGSIYALNGLRICPMGLLDVSRDLLHRID